VSELARAAWSTFKVSLKLRFVSQFSYLNWLLFPLLLASVGLFVLDTPGASSTHLAYAVLGGGLVGYWGSAYLDAGNGIQEERWNGTLEQIFASPTPLLVILLGKSCGGLVVGLLSFVPTVTLAYLGFQAALPSVDPLRFAISFGALTFSFLAIALTLTPLYSLWRWSFSVLNGLELGVYVLCGFMFPVAILAPWAQGLAGFLAPTWATRALYASTTAEGPHDFALWWFATIALSVTYLVGAALLYRLVDRRARVSGELALA
jgi:ABC-2 type transport system permease protein